MEKINYQQDDATIYKKAKTRVLIRLWVSYLLLLLYFIGVWALLHMDFFAIQESQLSNTLLIVLSAGQLILYFILFLMLSGGYKVFRIFYWICYVFEIALLMVPGYYLINDLSSILVYGALIGCMLVKLIFLSALGSYLKQNRWAKVFFDYVIEIEDDEYDEQEEEIFEPIRSTYHDPEEEIEEEEYEEKEPYTLPQISIRLGIAVYASLMVFPILVQIFSSFFVSNDLKTVFATKDIFILCIVSAVIWTIPIFFMYYNHPASKKILLGCLLAEGISIAAFLPRFIGYITSGEYPLRVFILFILVDLLRYIILYIALRPISKV